MIFKQIEIGGDRNFAYLVGDDDTRKAALIDPGVNPEKALQIVDSLGLEVAYIINTHGHGDHSGGNEQVKRKTGACVAAHKDESVLKDVALEDGACLALGSVELKVLHTPGHTPGSICILVDGKLVTGDTLFVGKVGGTGAYFPGSDAKAQHASLKRLMKLPDETEVYPGHNYYGGQGERKSSTIGEERRTNPFILCKDFDAFCDLKENWAEYKEKHGIK